MLDPAKERRLVERYSKMLLRGLCATKAKRRLRIYAQKQSGQLSAKCLDDIAAITESARLQKHLARSAKEF